MTQFLQKDEKDPFFTDLLGSNDECYHALVPIIDHLFNRFTQSVSGPGRHRIRFEADAFLHHLMKRRAEQRRLPQGIPIMQVGMFQFFQQVVAMEFGADER